MVSKNFYTLEALDENIVVRVLKFAGYAHYYKSLPRNSFGLILKSKMAVMAISSTGIKGFCTF